MKTKLTSVHMPEDVLGQVAARGGLRSTVPRDLDRYYSLMRKALAGMEFTLAEVSLIVDAMNGAIMSPATARYLWALVEDGIKLGGAAEGWGASGKALVEKLKGLSEFQSIAIVDAAERYWTATGKGTGGHTDDLLKEIFIIQETEG